MIIEPKKKKGTPNSLKTQIINDRETGIKKKCMGLKMRMRMRVKGS